MAQATDDEIRGQMERFTTARQRIDSLQTIRDNLQTERSIINQKLDNVNAEIVNQRSTAIAARVELKTLLGRV